MDEMSAEHTAECRELSERKLLAEVAQGKPDALVALAERYQRPLFVYLLRLLHDDGLAEEVLQDVLVALWQRAGSFAGRSRVSTWIFAIAHRQALQAARRRHLRLISTDECPDMPEEGQDAERLAWSLALQEDLEAALERLSPIHRETLELALSQGFSYEEIATITAVPIGTVRSRINQARRLMKQMLIQRGWGERAKV